MTAQDKPPLTPLLDYLLEQRGVDFSGYHPAMLERRIGKRLAVTACRDYAAYLSRLQRDGDELDRLLDVITINVSRFFRDTLTFEMLADKVLPAIIQTKSRSRDHSLRVWSAGCARGEEPYSLAILIDDLLRKEETALGLHLFATDVDPGALENARQALYPLSSVEHIKHRLLLKYFTPEGASFRLCPEIQRRVTFSRHDMLDRRHSVPPESVFGNFDLVLCRNLLIYFDTPSQERILERLHHALAPNGVLVLGEAEAPTLSQRSHFRRLFEFGPIYRKVPGGQ